MIQVFDMSQYVSTEQLILDLLNGHAPRLIELTLPRVALRKWRSPILTVLRRLHLSDIQSGPSLQVCIDMLRAPPTMESLTLCMVEFTTGV